MEEKEFYELIRKKTNEISLLDVPENVRDELYSQVGETILRYEENRKIINEISSLIPELEKGLAERARIDEGIRKSLNEAKKSLDRTNNLITALKIINESRN